MKIDARYKNVLSIINEKLSTLSDPKIIERATELKQKLQTLVEDINIAHDGKINGYMNPHIMSHRRHELIAIRERLYKLLDIPLKERQSS